MHNKKNELLEKLIKLSDKSKVSDLIKSTVETKKKSGIKDLLIIHFLLRFEMSLIELLNSTKDEKIKPLLEEGISVINKYNFENKI